MSTTHVMDILSSNSVLSRIFCYLEPRDVTSCQMVSRLFHSEIQRNWNKMKKRSIRMRINKGHTGTIITLFSGKRLWQVRTLENLNGCDVIPYNKFAKMSIPLIPIKTHFDTHLEFLRDIIEIVKSKFRIENLFLNKFVGLGGVDITDAELKLIFESTREDSPNISIENMKLTDVLIDHIQKITGLSMYCNRFRYLLLILGFFCLTSIASNYIIINFTFICMEKDTSDMVENGNGTSINRYAYSPSEKSWIIWAVAAGTIIGTPPVNWAYITYGAKWPFFIAGCLSVLSTVSIPTAAHLGIPFLLVARFIQGLAYSADFAAIGIMCVRWAPLAQTGLFISILTSFTPVATVVTNPLSGWLCSSSVGWRMAYYVHAAIGAVVFLLWLVFYQDDPQLHKSVSSKELDEIQRNKTKAHIERDSFVPYWDIIKNRVILIVWFNAFVEMVSVTLLLTYSPIYFHTVLGYDIQTTGLLVSIAASVHLPLKLVMGIASDYITCVTERVKMCIYNTVAVGVAGVFCGLIGIVPATLPGVCVFLFGGVYSSMGMNPGGFYKCGTFVSRQYAHFVLATIQFMKCIALFVAPLFVAVFVHDEKDSNQWSIVYIINALLLIIANVMFYFVATDQPADFTQITRETRKMEKKEITL